MDDGLVSKASVPDDYQKYERGRYYKVGLRGLLFVWHPEREEWVRSTRSPEDVDQYGQNRPLTT